MRALLAMLVLPLWSGAALAHTVVPGVGGFAGGLLHPLLVPTHAVALAGLGLFASQQASPARRAILVTFAAGLLVAIVGVVLAFAVEDADMVVLLGAAIAGLLAALARPAPFLLALPLAAAIGVAIELDAVPDEISMQATMLSLVGTAITAMLALVAVAAIVAGRPRGWPHIAVRVVGSWIAASAILVLALRLTR